MPPLKKNKKITAYKERMQAVDEFVEQFELLTPKDQMTVLDRIGLASQYYTCQRCNKLKPKKDFYVSTGPGQASGITCICKQCANEVAVPIVDGIEQQPSKQTVDDALYLLDKPMLESVWDASLLEAANQVTGRTKNNVWTSYIKNIQMVNYNTYTYKQSDGYTGGILSLEDLTSDSLPKDQEILEQFEKNKDDTLRLLGYLPFEKEKITDQPFLYAQLIGFLDSSEEGNDDMMRTSSVISIVRSFLQLSNIDDMIAQLSQDPRHAEKNISTIRALQQMKNQITQGATKLAEQSCISLKNSKHSLKGETTWTGKMAKIEELELREYDVNGYDIETCKGMQQVADISMNAILKSLYLDESEYSEMLAEQTKKIAELNKKTEGYREACRILLKENLDFRDLIESKDINIDKDMIDLNSIVNNYFK